MTQREEILEQAKVIVTVDRNSNYGEPEQNFQRIADMWSGYLGVGVQAHDVAAMMILMKVSRIATSPQVQDHWVDIAGYAGCGGEMRPQAK